MPTPFTRFRSKLEQSYELTHLSRFLDNQRHAGALHKEWSSRMKKIWFKPRKTTALENALLAGYVELHVQACDEAKRAKDAGQLLFAFEGTTVLHALRQGGAA